MLDFDLNQCFNSMCDKREIFKMNTIEILVAAGALFLGLLYYYITKNAGYWRKYKIVGPRPTPLFGNILRSTLGRLNIVDEIKEAYDAYPNEPVVGMFFFTKPVLLIRDRDVAKDILIRDFSKFSDRGIKIHEDLSPLDQHLFFLEPKRWKPLRKRLSPVFTSGKLREMFYLINECADQLVKFTDKLVAKGEPIEVRELTAKYTTDVIGVCAFGLNMKAMANGDHSDFRRIGREVFKDNWANKFRRLNRNFPHWIAQLLSPITQRQYIDNFMIQTVTQTIEYREKNSVKRGDYIDLLIDLKNHPEKIDEAKMTDTILTAQVFVFFVAGFETSSTAMSHTMYELALNPDVQDKLREEINMTYEKHDGKLTYEVIKQMKYLDKVFKETLRKYPPGTSLTRKAMADHTFENTKISIPKGTTTVIPVYAIHHDPNIYPDPEKFDPERFSDENIDDRGSMSFLPFGDGPRNCIGARFAEIQSKVGIVVAVKNFEFHICQKTRIPYEKTPNSVVLCLRGGTYLRLTKV